MVKVSQFVSRNIMTRDKMSQPLVAWCLVLGACRLIPDPLALLNFGPGTNRSGIS